jgi:hypothetical protein
MSKAHRTKESVRKGEMSIRDVALRTIFSPTHFPKFLAATMTVSGFVGYYYMASVHYRYIQVWYGCEDGISTVVCLTNECVMDDGCTFEEYLTPIAFFHCSARKIFIKSHWNRPSNQSVKNRPRFMQ